MLDLIYKRNLRRDSGLNLEIDLPTLRIFLVFDEVDIFEASYQTESACVHTVLIGSVRNIVN